MRTNLVLAVLLLCALSLGCPPDTGNTLVVHNQCPVAFNALEVSRIDFCGAKALVGDGRDKGINILPEPIEPGGTFTVDGLVDGEYEIIIHTEPFLVGDTLLTQLDYTQVFEGGNLYDLYARI